MEGFREIPLSRGMVALVSESDYERVSEYKWHVVWDKRSKSFYAMRNIKRPNGKYSKTAMHRFILDCPSNLEVDHINHSTLDNRRENIRAATTSQNQFNRGKRCDNKTGFKGVFRVGDKWRAAIKVNRKKHHLGSFSTPEEAHAAYCSAALEKHGEFAKVA